MPDYVLHASCFHANLSPDLFRRHAREYLACHRAYKPFARYFEAWHRAVAVAASQVAGLTFAVIVSSPASRVLIGTFLPSPPSPRRCASLMFLAGCGRSILATRVTFLSISRAPIPSVPNPALEWTRGTEASVCLAFRRAPFSSFVSRLLKFA
jgi:hypothetical protein